MPPLRRLRRTRWRIGWQAQSLLPLCALLLACATVQAAAGTDHAGSAESPTVSRLQGSDRYATSLEFARAYAAERGGRLESALLVSGTSWPDAVTAAGLAGLLDGPILLVGPDGLGAGALDFLGQTGVSELVAVGTENVLASSSLVSARSVDADIERIAASDRYSASVAVARRMAAGGHGFGLARTAILASGEVFVDAMVAGAIAARGTHPVLLTPPGDLHPAVEQFIGSDLVERVIIMGGPAAVSAHVEQRVERLGKHVVRIAGATRFETATAAADYLQDRYSWTARGVCFSEEVFGLSTARAPWDAFTAGPLLGRLCAPLLLADQARVPEATAHWVGPGTDRLVVLGGPAAVSAYAVAQFIADSGIGSRARAEQQMARLVNELRAGLGLEPVRHHAGLRRVARDWSAQMPEDGPFGHNPDWIDQYPLGWHLYGENVAREYVAGTLAEAVQAAFKGLRDSPPHYSNMTNPSFTDIGVGIAVGERKIMVTQNFSSYPAQPVDLPPAKPRFGDSTWNDRTQLRWESTTSDLPITHWKIDDGSLPGKAPTFAWGYAWHDPPEGIHRVRVRACNIAGCSERNVYTFTVGDATPAPGTPAGPTLAVGIDGQGVTVSWNVGASEGDSPIEGWTYHLERNTAGADGLQRYTHEYLPANQRTRRHPSLQPGRYTAYVLAHNADGPGAWASMDFTVPGT